MKHVPLEYPKQKLMYDPSIPPIRSKWGDNENSHAAAFLLSKSHSRSPSPLNVANRIAKRKEVKCHKQSEMPDEDLRLSKSFVSKKSQRILSALQLKPFLERQEEMEQNKRSKLEMLKIIDQKVQEQEAQLPKKTATRSTEQFLKDSYAWLDYKHSKQQQLKSMYTETSSFQPKINQKSNKIVEHRRDKQQSVSPMVERLAQPKSPTKLKPEIYSFSPIINSKSRKLVERSKSRRGGQ